MMLLHKLLDSAVATPVLTGSVVGVLIGMPFVLPILTPLALFGFGLLTFLVTRYTSYQLLCFAVAVFGIKAFIALSFVWSVYPVSWLITLPPMLEWAILLLYHISSAVWLASAGIVFAFLLTYLPITYRIWAVPPTVVIAEYFGAITFSVFMYGEGGSITGAFSFGHSGYLFSWFYPMAASGGVYSVGFIGLLCTVVPVAVLVGQRRWAGVIGVFLLVYVGWMYQQTPVAPSLPTLTLVETIFGADTPLAPEEEAKAIADLVALAAQYNPDYILLPEDSRYLAVHYRAHEVGMTEAVEAWRIMNATTTAVIIDSARTVDHQYGTIQRAYIWGQSGAIEATDKQYLVPQGEYLPALYNFVFRLIGGPSVSAFLTEAFSYRRGGQTISHEASASIPHILFCFESVDPWATKRLMKQRPSDFIVHPISHSWFREPTVLWQQLDTMLRFQAVAAGVPIVSVGNDVAGKVYLPNGAIDIPITATTTPYGSVRLIGA